MDRKYVYVLLTRLCDISNWHNLNFQSKDGKSWREYIIGFDRVIKVPLKNVNTFIKWSTSPFVNEMTYDQKLVHAMMLLCNNKKELHLSKLNRDVLEFIKRKFIT